MVTYNSGQKFIRVLLWIWNRSLSWYFLSFTTNNWVFTSISELVWYCLSKSWAMVVFSILQKSKVGVFCPLLFYPGAWGGEFIPGVVETGQQQSERTDTTWQGLIKPDKDRYNLTRTDTTWQGQIHHDKDEYKLTRTDTFWQG